MRDFRRNDRGGSRRNGFSDRRDNDRPQMFDAVCANCGKDCRVPFRPTGDKPIYCSECFEELGNGREDRGFIKERNYKNSGSSTADSTQIISKLNSINTKLDRLINLLEPVLLQTERKDTPVTES